MVGARKVVTRAGAGYTLHLDAQERAVVARLLGELRDMQTDPEAAEAVRRLFPVVHPGDPDQEAEYQRLMREELIASRAAAIDTVVGVLGRPGRKVSLNEDEMSAFVKAVNAVRLVLGTLLEVTDDEDEVRPELLESPEYGLYGYLSYVLDACIRLLSADV
jgi:hypothetical protein